MVSINLDINEKQKLLAELVFGQYTQNTGLRYFFYGGGIRGGKTVASLSMLIMLCRKFPGSKWVCIRENFPTLQRTTIESFIKIIKGSTNWTWNKAPGNYYAQYINGSKILFLAENYKFDPSLNWMLGLEVNGFLLEQIEELERATFDMAIQRLGSHIIDGEKQPIPMIFSTFNPTNGWLKEDIYKKRFQLSAPYCFIEALAADNPTVSKDQYDAWESLDELSRRRMILGDWEAFDQSGIFAYNFSESHVVEDIAPEPYWNSWLSFDFNVDPMTAVLIQINPEKTCFNVIKEFRQENSNIHEFVPYILQNLPQGIGRFMVTGDYAGMSRQSIAPSSTNHYRIIEKLMNIIPDRIKLNVNPQHSNSYVFINSALKNKRFDIKINRLCRYLIRDLSTIKYDGSKIVKDQKDKSLTGRICTTGHLLDCFRYALHNTAPNISIF